MTSYNYGYTYRDGPLLRWGHGTPVQTRAADATALGSLGGSTLDEPTLLLPAPGAPEVIGVTGKSMMPMSGTQIMQAMGGCSCSGTCGCGPAPAAALSDFVDTIPGGYLTLGAAALLAWHFMRKRRRR